MGLDIKDFDQLQRLRSVLQNINQVGYDFRTFDQRYPLNGLTPLQSDQVKNKFQRLVEDVIQICDGAVRDGLLEEYDR